MNATNYRIARIHLFAILAAGVMVAACAKGARNNDSHERSGIELTAVVTKNQMKLMIVNGTNSDITINPIFNFGYQETSIQLEIEGRGGVHGLESKSGVPEILPPASKLMVLQYNSFYGANYDVSDIAEMYSLNKECYTGNAVYKNPLHNSKYTDLVIRSNRFKICVE